MGAPKQKWNSEEEAALKAGVAKYGTGKWSTILKDPQFSGVLHSRSNVDLKDKWRNINVMASGLGSRQKARLAVKNKQPTSNHDDNTMALSMVVASDVETIDAKPLAICDGNIENAGSKKPMTRLDNLVVEAVTNLKEPRGSNRASISAYIEELYLVPSNFEKLLAANLKLLTENRKLIKVKNHYRIAPRLTMIDVRGDPSQLRHEGKQTHSQMLEKDDIKILTKAQIDAELEKMRNMTAEEAAAAAAQAVAEAEAAIMEAEKAAREAEDAEADAEAAQVFAEAAIKALNSRTLHAW